MVISVERCLWAVLLLAAFGGGFVVGYNWQPKAHTLHIEITKPIQP
jgi:hypothetical protein